VRPVNDGQQTGLKWVRICERAYCAIKQDLRSRNLLVKSPCDLDGVTQWQIGEHSDPLLRQVATGKTDLFYISNR